MACRLRQLVTIVTMLLFFLTSMSGFALAESSGRRDYMENCAGCHGVDGTGHGPHLYVLSGITPPNLTLLSKNNHGVFPFQKVEDAIDGRKGIASHKRLDMPFWGVRLQKEGKEFSPESNAAVKARIEAVTRYVESIQKK